MGAWETLAGALFAFWVLLACDRLRWFSRSWTLRPVDASAKSLERIVAVIPARNEEDSLPDSIPPLLRQNASLDRIIIVDDHSTDETARVAQDLAARNSNGGGVPLDLISAPARPAGWTGKLHALQVGVNHACAASPPEWFLFTDADIQHCNDSVAKLEARARDGGYDLVSVMVRLRAESRWEKLLIPPFVYFFQLMYPFRRVSQEGSRVAAAAGGCVLIRRAALERSGGLEAMHGAIIDDVTLARRVKRSGGPCWLGIDPAIVSLRPYDGLRDIVGMVARTAFTELGYRYSLVVATWAMLGFFFVSPPLLTLFTLVAGRPLAALLAAFAWVIQSATLLPVVRHQRVPAGYALTLPVAALFYAYMTTVSAWRHFCGRGILWRGRATDASP